MGRLKGLGFELNSQTADVEHTGVSATSAAYRSISTTTVRSGTYAHRTNPTTGFSNWQYAFASSDQTAPFYIRIYVRYASLPSAQIIAISVENTAVAKKISIRVNTDGTLELWNEEDSAQIGSDSTALSTGTWYRIELKVDTTTISSTSVEALLDGVSFASGSANLTTGVARITVGNTTSPTATYEAFWDDIAINDSSGSFQNSWPGEGEIIHLRPNAAGDNEEWTGTGTNQTLVDEVTPNDATDFVQSLTGPPNLDDYNLDATPAAMASDDTINVVQVGVRYRSEDAGGGDGFSLRIKASASGTVEESAEITPNSLTWVTNAIAAPRNYALTLYDLPGASTTAWTKADLDTAQIGLNQIDFDGAGFAQISTMWLLVDHQPAAAVATNKLLMLMGVGV